MSVEPIRKTRVERMAGGNGHGPRIIALELKVADMNSALTTVQASVTKVQTDTAEILSLLSYSKSGMAFVRKNGGRIVTAILGYLVLSGKLTKETGNFFQHILGL